MHTRMERHASGVARRVPCWLRGRRYVAQDQRASILETMTLPAQEEVACRSWVVPLLPLALGSLVEPGNEIPDGLCIWGLKLFQKHQRRS